MIPGNTDTDANSNISRWIAFLLGPLAILVGGFVAIKAKSWFNYDLEPAEATAYILGIVGGIAGLFVTWLHNRGKNEIAKTTGLSETQVEGIVSVIEERLPHAPDAPLTPGGGSPASPRAPGGSALHT